MLPHPGMPMLTTADQEAHGALAEPTYMTVGKRTFVLVARPPSLDLAPRSLTALIDKVRPDTLALPLCQARMSAVTHGDSWRELDVATVVRQGRALSFLAYLGYYAFMLRLGRGAPDALDGTWLEVCRAAQARELPLWLLDRDIEDSLRLGWQDLRWWQRLRLMARLSASFLRRTRPSDAQACRLAEAEPFSGALAALVAKESDLADALIEERARHACQRLEQAPGATVLVLLEPSQLAVVAQHLANPTSQPPRCLPPRSRRPWLMPLLLVAILLPPWVLRDRLPIGDLLVGWLLINAGCVTVTSLLARAHPLAVLVGALCAPFSLLSPVLKASTTAAAVEALVRKPRVADAERLPADLRAWRRFRANPLSRVLIVFAAASLGSALGSWIGAWWIATRLLAHAAP